MLSFTLALALAQLSPAAPTPELPTPGLLVPGSYHGDEVDPAAAGEWMALVSTPAGWALAPARVSVSGQVDPVVDNEGEATGWRVDVAGVDGARLLVRGVDGLAAGPVPGLGDAATLAPGTERVVGVGEPTWLALSASGEVVRHGGWEEVRGYTLVASRGDVRQVLLTHEALEEATPRVIWAGDLDGDGLLDLVVDETWHYNVSRPTLWLSSRAADGALLGRVAAFTSVGC